MPSSETRWCATIRSVRSGASVADGIRVGGRHLEREIGPADAGELGGEHEQVGPVRQRRERPGEAQREVERRRRARRRRRRVDHRVLEAEQHARIDLEREVEVDRALATLLGMEVDLPGLAQRVALDEVTLVVHVEAVLDRVILQVGDEAGDVDDRHVSGERTERARQRGHRVVARVLPAGIERVDMPKNPWIMPSYAPISTAHARGARARRRTPRPGRAAGRTRR